MVHIVIRLFDLMQLPHFKSERLHSLDKWFAAHFMRKILLEQSSVVIAITIKTSGDLDAIIFRTTIVYDVQILHG